MDPWQPYPVSDSNSISEEANTNVVDLALHNHEKNQSELTEQVLDNSNFNETARKDLSFGDNFQPFIKLPDSQEYLESLEKKLKLIQKGGKKGASANAIIRSLGQTKESCMIKLLSNSVEKLTVEGEIFEELKVNPLLKKLAPEKQALSAEELVHLLKADQLDIILGNNNNNQEDSTNSLEENQSVAVPSTSERRSSSTGESEKDKDSTENLTATGEDSAKN